MKTFLVTGAAGFIGAAVAKKLIDDGHQVITIDNLSTGFKENIPAGISFIEGDCADPEVINQLDNYRFDSIFHIAGQSSGEISFEDPTYDLKTNTLSTLLLLQYAVKTECKKFIYGSTMSVYGDQPDTPVNENAETLPKSFYAVGKIASEHYLRIYSQYGMTNTALRLFNVYGPGQNMVNLKQGMVSIFLAQAVEDKRIVVKGSSGRQRDFIYIDDVVEAFLAANRLETSGYRFYNIGTGVRTTVRELLANIEKELPFNIEIKFSDSTPGDQFGIFADISKAKNKMNWYPKTELKKGLSNMVKWYLSNES